MKKTDKYGVFLSRFSPLHKGHQKIIDKVIKDFGPKKSLIMIGSSNSYNQKTPYRLEQRVLMIRKLYPKIKILPIPDVNPLEENFENKTLNIWLAQLKALEGSLAAKFVFYGGSNKDLAYLREYFQTSIPVNRNRSAEKISATKVRQALAKKDINKLNKFLDPKTIDICITGYDLFLRSQKVKL